MATVHSTAKGRAGRNRLSKDSNVRAKAGAGAKAGKRSSLEDVLPGGLIDVVEEQRMALGVALTLLTSLDVTLQQAEGSGGDILDEDDAADLLVLKARAIARPVDLVRLAIQRVYQAQAKLDSLYLERAARDAK